MASHLLLLSGFAFFVSLVFAVLAKDDPREQLKFGGLLFVLSPPLIYRIVHGLLFVGFVGTAIAISWLMLPFPF